jgi:hypothetical protein
MYQPIHRSTRTGDEVAHDIMIFAVSALLTILAAYLATKYMVADMHLSAGFIAPRNGNPIIDWTISHYGFNIGWLNHTFGYGIYNGHNTGVYIDLGRHTYGIELWGHPGLFRS